MALKPRDVIGKYISYGDKGNCGFALVDRVTDHNDKTWAISGCMSIMSNGRIHLYKGERMIPLCLIGDELPEHFQVYDSVDDTDDQLFIEALRGTGKMDTGITLAIACMRDKLKEDIVGKFHGPKREPWLPLERRQ